MSGANLFNVSFPRDVGLARFVLERLGRPQWLDVPWVHASAKLELQADIVEDLADFPPAVMAEADLVSLALRLGVMGSMPELSWRVNTFAFYPTATREQLTKLLVARGFEEQRVPAAEHEKIALEVQPHQARSTILGSMFRISDTPLARALFWEHCDESPESGATLFANLTPWSAIFAAKDMEQELVLRAAKKVAPHVTAARGATFVSLCAKVMSPAKLEELAKEVPNYAGDPPALSSAVARSIFARSAPETKKKLLERDAKLHDLGVASPSPTIRAHVAPHLTEPALMRALTTDTDPKVRAALAKNPRLESAALEALARAATESPTKDEATDGDLALALAKHPNSASETLVRYVGHPRDDVRASLAKRAALPIEATLALANDTSPAVRLEIVKRPDLPPARRLAFKLDEDPTVRAYAIAGDPAASADELATVTQAIRSETRMAIAKASTDPALLAAFATDTDRNVRIIVGQHASTPIDVLDRFSRDPDGYVRGGVAVNVAAGATILGRLAVDEVHQVRQMAAASLGKLRKASVKEGAVAGDEIPGEIEEVLVDPMAPPRRELTRQKELGRAVLDALVDDADVKVRALLVRSKATPEDLLDRLATDADPSVRTSVASSPRASAKALAVLVDDESFAARESARERMKKLQSAKPKKAKK